jgi:hypothetical protein
MPLGLYFGLRVLVELFLAALLLKEATFRFQPTRQKLFFFVFIPIQEIL